MFSYYKCPCYLRTRPPRVLTLFEETLFKAIPCYFYLCFMTGSVIILRNTAHISPFLYHSIIPNTGHLCFSNNTSQTEAAQS